MPLTRTAAPLLATAALLFWPVAARAGDPLLSPTAPPGLQQGQHPPGRHPRPKPVRHHPRTRPARHHHAPKPARPRGGALPHTGSDLALEAAAAAMLIAGGTLLRAPRYLGRS
jgi:hypothetical protein